MPDLERLLHVQPADHFRECWSFPVVDVDWSLTGSLWFPAEFPFLPAVVAVLCSTHSWTFGKSPMNLSTTTPFRKHNTAGTAFTSNVWTRSICDSTSKTARSISELSPSNSSSFGVRILQGSHHSAWKLTITGLALFTTCKETDSLVKEFVIENDSFAHFLIEIVMVLDFYLLICHCCTGEGLSKDA